MATTVTSAPTTRRATTSAEGRLTASWSPPKAWPAVTVAATSPASRIETTRSDSASGSAAPSVMT
jgi:hypothetical protein